MKIQQTLMPGYELSEADLVQMALDRPLEQKIEEAILFYRHYCNGAYGAFSGGKDSCVIKQLAIDAGVEVDWWYNNTTIDPPELVKFIKTEHSEVRWNNPKQHLLSRMVEKGVCPTRMMRWCCEEYKEQGGSGRDKIFGVRISESVRRSKRWKLIVTHMKTKQKTFCPIAYWTDKDVWDYIKLRNIPYCCLYDEGFKRLGCVGCPLAGPKGQRREFDRWPRYEKMWRKAFAKLWERWHGIPTRKGEPRFFEKFGSPDRFYEWWVSGRAFPDAENCVFEDMMEQR